MHEDKEKKFNDRLETILFETQSFLITKEEILAKAIPSSENADSGVYFLIDGDEIVYVGQSNFVRARIEQHLAEKIKTFDRISIVLCPSRILDAAEWLYISKFQPKYNKYPGKNILIKSNSKRSRL